MNKKIKINYNFVVKCPLSSSQYIVTKSKYIVLKLQFGSGEKQKVIWTVKAQCMLKYFSSFFQTGII